MTAPINPQVIQQEGLGETVQRNLAPLLQTVQQNKQLEIARAKLKLDEDRQRQQVSEFLASQQQKATELDTAQQEGMAIGEALGRLAADENASATIQAVNVAAQSAIQAGRAQAVPQAVSISRAAASGEEEARALAGRIQRREAAITNIGERLGESAAGEARDLFAFAEGGISTSLSKEQIGQLFPSLKPTLAEGVDVAALNGAVTLWKTGNMTWGEARRSFGMPALPGGMPDEQTFEDIAGKGRGPGSEQQRKAIAMHGQLVTANAEMQSLLDETGGLNALGAVLKASRGNIIEQLVINPAAGVFTPRQQELVKTIRQFGNAWRNFISGQAATDQEYADILSYATPSLGDTPQTTRSKALMRQMMIEAANEASGGFARPSSDILGDMIERGRAAGFGEFTDSEGKSALDYLAKQQRDAKIFEASLARGQTIVIDGSEDTPDTLESLYQYIDDVAPTPPARRRDGRRF